FTSLVLNFLSRLFLRQPRSPHFPYTTLFRSRRARPARAARRRSRARRALECAGGRGRRSSGSGDRWRGARPRRRAGRHDTAGRRSEEHTSELQSRENLVCRLLLEKKKNKNNEKEEYVKAICGRCVVCM